VRPHEDREPQSRSTREDARDAGRRGGKVAAARRRDRAAARADWPEPAIGILDCRKFLDNRGGANPEDEKGGV
jgi:hypothetical protein